MDPKLEKAHEKLTNQVMDRPGITGTAIGERDGEPCLLVYLRDKKAAVEIPDSVDGFKVLGEITGDIRPY